VGIGGVRWHGWEARSCRPTEKNSENNLLEKARGNKSTAAKSRVGRFQAGFSVTLVVAPRIGVGVGIRPGS